MIDNFPNQELGASIVKHKLLPVSLRLGEEPSNNHNKIICANVSDYKPHLKGYCGMFLPKTKIRYKDIEANTDESDIIRMKLQVVSDWAKRVCEK